MATVGIDLGTTNSLVARMTDDGPQVLTNELGDRMTPSAIAAADDGTILVGRAARDRLAHRPESGRAFFKRDMGSDRTYLFGDREWSPIECSTAILLELKRIAEDSIGGSVDQAVISVPAYFNDGQRQATIDASQAAGMRVKRLVNEPTAAALAYGYDHRDAEHSLLVFDLGGGTFDVTILELFEGIIDVRSSGGISRLGGEDFTDRLLDHFCRSLLREELRSEDRARIRQRIEIVKRSLSREAVATLDWQGESHAIDRQMFLDVTGDLFGQLRPVMIRCLRDIGLRFHDIDGALLVGGASRMPGIRDLLSDCGIDTIRDEIDPDLVVARGAAVQASLIDKDAGVSDMVMTDVAPHTLGVNVSRELPGGRIETGFFSPIIDRNTTLPVSRSDRFTTLRADQDQIELVIYQGENRLVKDNHQLGTLKIRGLRARPGQEHPGEIDVRFTYDMNGILEVDATVLATGKTANLVIEERPGRLSKKQIKECLERLKPLKIHPRDLLPNRARLERADRLFPELSGSLRQHLEHLLAAFEAALETQEREQIAIHGQLLDQFLDHFFADEGELQPSRNGEDGDRPA